MTCHNNCCSSERYTAHESTQLRFDTGWNEQPVQTPDYECYVFTATFLHNQPGSCITACGLRVVRIDPLHFLAGCYTRRLNRALSVLSLSLDYLSVSVVLLTRATFCTVYFVLHVYSVSWLFWSGCQYQCKWLTGKTRLRNDLQCVDGDFKPYSLTHSLAVAFCTDYGVRTLN